MVTFVIEERGDVFVAHVTGRFGSEDSPESIARQLWRFGRDAPLVVDLSGLEEMDDPEAEVLIRYLDLPMSRRTTALLHQDQNARQALRRMPHRLPVVPTIEHAMREWTREPNPGVVLPAAPSTPPVSSRPSVPDLR